MLISLRLSAAALAVGACGAASAHDTWFETRSARLPGAVLLELGTGNRFPRHEFGIDVASLAARGCAQGGQPVPLAAVSSRPAALALLAQARGAAGLSCWAELKPVEVELDPKLVDVYLADIDALPAVRAAWAAMQSRGLPWRETYVKNARVEVAGSDGGAPAAAPAPIGIDVVLDSGLGVIASGAPLRLRLLRDGAPLAGQPVGLDGTAGAPTRWLRSDADGRVAFDAPAPGRWIVRGTDLRVSPADPDRWDSRFFSLAFEVR